MNSKNKGGSFERKICKLLSLWYSEGKRDDIFYRSASSGAMATMRFKKGKTTTGQSGDITSTDIEGIKFIEQVSIELKHYKTFSLDFLLFNKPTKVRDWWEQCICDANRTSKYPLLIIKKNGLPEIIIYNYKFKNVLDDYTGKIQYQSFMMNTDLLFATTLDNFLSISPEAIKLGLGILNEN